MQSSRRFFQLKGHFLSGCGTIIQHLSEKYPEGFQDTKWPEILPDKGIFF